VTAEELLEGTLLKTAEDAQAAGRITARAYADEMEKLCSLFGLKLADSDEEKKKRFEEFRKKKNGKGKDDCPPSKGKDKDDKDEDEKNSSDLDAIKKMLEG